MCKTTNPVDLLNRYGTGRKLREADIEETRNYIYWVAHRLKETGNPYYFQYLNPVVSRLTKQTTLVSQQEIQDTILKAWTSQN